MAVVLESYTSVADSGNVTSLTLNKPTGVATGDFLILLMGDDDNAGPEGSVWNAVTGWTLETQFWDAAADCSIGIYSRVADGTEGASVTVTKNLSTEGWGFYLRLSGVDTTTGVDVMGTADKNGATSSITCASVTATGAGMAIGIISTDGADLYPFSWSGTGWGEILDIQAGTSGTEAAGSFGTKSITGSGATGTATVTASTSDGMIGVQFTVLEAASGPTYDETGRATTITSTTAITNLLTMGELTKATTVTSTSAITDVGTFIDTLKVTSITSTTAITDLLTFTEASATTITSTSAITDVLTLSELLATSIVSTFGSTDVYTGSGTNYDETGRATTVTSTFAILDAITGTETAAITITSTLASSDGFNTSDTSATTITSTIAITDLLTFNETLATSITSTWNTSDIAAFVDLIATTINSVVGSTDVYTPFAPPAPILRDLRGRGFVRPSSNTRDRTD